MANETASKNNGKGQSQATLNQVANNHLSNQNAVGHLSSTTKRPDPVQDVRVIRVPGMTWHQAGKKHYFGTQ